MTEGEAFNVFIDYLRERKAGAVVDVGRVIDKYLYAYEQQTVQSGNKDGRRRELSPVFLSAAWDLSLLGVLRPGAAELPAASFDFDGSRYIFTEFGEDWASTGEEAAFVPLAPDAFGALVSTFHHFGENFQHRAREAALCFRARAFLACCAMAGAAAESVLLAAAIAVEQDADTVLRIYNSKGGRRKLEAKVTGRLRTDLRDALAPLFTVAKYWRDEASHGAASSITQPEARTALVTLYLYARIVHGHWQEIVDSA